MNAKDGDDDPSVVAEIDPRDAIVDIDSLESIPPEAEIESADVKARAVAGASAMVLRTFAIRAIGLLGNIVLARLLAPDDFGLAALGVTIYVFVNTVAEGGIAAGFVRGKIAPTRTDLHAAVAVQAYASTVLLAGVWVVALALGSREALVAAVMVSAIPLVAFRTPAYLYFERSLSFAPLVRVEVAETLAYFAFSIGLVAAGAGVWGLAFGQVLKVIVGANLMVRAHPGGFVGPRWNSESVRKMLGFGLRFQGIALAALAKTQGMNVAVAAAAGLSGLGIWSLVFRLMQIPLMVFQSLRRVSYPAVARLMANEDAELDVTLLRVGKLSAIMGAVMVVGVLGASDPGVVLVFGEKWSDASNILPLTVLVVFVNGPVSVAAFSYAMAAGRLNLGLANTVVQAVVGPLLLIGTYPYLGLESIAVANLALAIFEAAVLGWVLWDGLKVNLGPMMVGYGAMVCVAGFAGREIAVDVLTGWPAVIAGAVVAEAALLIMLFLLQRTALMDAVRLTKRVASRG